MILEYLTKASLEFNYPHNTNYKKISSHYLFYSKNLLDTHPRATLMVTPVTPITDPQVTPTSDPRPLVVQARVRVAVGEDLQGGEPSPHPLDPLAMRCMWENISY